MQLRQKELKACFLIYTSMTWEASQRKNAN